MIAASRTSTPAYVRVGGGGSRSSAGMDMSGSSVRLQPAFVQSEPRGAVGQPLFGGGQRVGGVGPPRLIFLEQRAAPRGAARRLFRSRAAVGPAHVDEMARAQDSRERR